VTQNILSERMSCNAHGSHQWIRVKTTGDGEYGEKNKTLDNNDGDDEDDEVEEVEELRAWM
jgi:hypothetical protein